MSGVVPRWFLGAATLGFLFIVLPARAQDGGVPFSSPIYGSCPEADPPEAVEVHGSFFDPVDTPDGGQSWLLSPARASRNACLMATCEEYRAQIENEPTVQPMGYVIAAAVGMGLGFIGGVALVIQLSR